MKIIYDAMGGDNAPGEIVKGAIKAKKEYNIDILFVGKGELIKEAILENNENIEDYDIVNATEIIDNDENPAFALIRKKDSSIVVGMNLLAEGKGDAIISAGSTGALLAGGIFIIKRIDNVERAPIGALIPTLKGLSLLIDSGANMDTNKELLSQFATMGYIYMRDVMGVENPKVGLMNVGSEDGKGNELTKGANELLKEKSNINYIGNIESRDIPFGIADVIVCDGFDGNIFLKTYEGTGLMILESFKRVIKGLDDKELMQNSMGIVGKVFENFDYRDTGGAPLLGVKKPVIKAHGSSDYHAIYSATKQAIAFIENDVIDKLTKNL
ncbi:MAG: phosphate acyltransferase PlsX [Tissierellia bacterium]|nr:phosphate acyltransferase PlsX [Tissierellia bacterium]